MSCSGRGLPDRRHHARAELAHDLLPFLGSLTAISSSFTRLERQIGDLLGVVMAIEAVALDRRLVLRNELLARRLARRAQRSEGAQSGELEPCTMPHVVPNRLVIFHYTRIAAVPG